MVSHKMNLKSENVVPLCSPPNMAVFHSPPFVTKVKKVIFYLRDNYNCDDYPQC